MRKQFEFRARLAIYFEQADVERLGKHARSEGKNLQDWARETLLEKLGEWNELQSRPDEAAKVPEVRQEVQGAPKGEVCPHKKAKGSLCYKCDPKFGNPVME